MKTPANICSGLLLVTVLLGLGCAGSPPKSPQPETVGAESHADARGYDPLELPADRAVVPRNIVRTGSIEGKHVIVEVTPEIAEDSLGQASIGPVIVTDTANSQVYRVQLFTSRVIGDARQAARVAEEIFDQPVYIDYEVPNYKIRVGNFADRDAAEDYQQRAKGAGYDNAWVVVVNVNVNEVAPLYDEDTGYLLKVPKNPADTVELDEEAIGGSEN